MISAHTPGPWMLNGTSIECDSGIHHIAEVSEWLPEFRAEREANARLIAAAPSLLEAARGLVRIVEAMRMTTGLGKNQIARLEAALSAIHAATGEK